jgi:iron complex outermembrane recepter protein
MGTTAKRRRRVLWLAAFAAGQASAMLASGVAWAQDQAQTLGPVTVTGSMIKRADAETAEAVTVLKADTLRAEGITSLEQVIGVLTSATPSVNIATSVGTFSGGGTFANLRGLGNGRTLVLLDGQRLAPNAAGTNVGGAGVDVSGIPFSAIDRVEVLREGASAQYGSDAIAGVINFITKKSFKGGTIQANIDVPKEGGGESHEADLTLGHGDLRKDGYNVLVTASFNIQQELKATQRGFSAYGFNPADGITATNYAGNFPGNVVTGNGLWQYINTSGPPCAGNPQLTTYFGDCEYRYSAATDLIPESHETSAMAQFTKALPYNNQIKAQYFWSQSEENGFSGPMEYFFQMDPASPYFPSAANLTCNARSGGCAGATPDLTDPIDAFWSDPNNSRYAGNVNLEQRLLLTFSGSNGGWDYSTDLNFSKNTNDSRNTGGYPNEAVLAPGGILSDLINPFGPQSAAGQALINSSYINGTYEEGQYTRFSFDGQATHELGDAFNSGTPATLALGFTMSTERYANGTTGYNSLVSAATGLTASSVSGNREVQAVFLELDVPITKKLDLDVQDREDRYSDFGTTNNGKLQLLYQPTGWLKLRGTASTGFRAPTLQNLYQPPSLAASSSGTMGDGNPFCVAPYSNPEWTQATCSAQGIGLYGGNRALTPETSKNFDLGFVLSPTADLGVTMDYYRVLIDNTISGVPPNAIYGNPTAFPQYIVPATTGTYAGTLVPSGAEAANCTPYTASTCGYIIENPSNTGFLSTSGFDLSVQYQQRTPIGTFHEDLEGTWVTQFKEQLYTNGPVLNLLGDLQIQELNPAFRWQHDVMVNWTSVDKIWGGGLSDRYYAGYVDENGSGPDNTGPRPHVGSYNLVDGYASITPIPKLTVLFGVKNILNTKPPLTNASQNNFAAGYNALIADPRLRNFYLNVKYSFPDFF